MIPFICINIYKYLYIVVISNSFVSNALIKVGVILNKGETCLGRQYCTTFTDICFSKYLDSSLLMLLYFIKSDLCST